MQVKITSSDFGKVGDALGIMYGIAQEYETGFYANDLIDAAGKYAAGIMSQDMDALAKSDDSLGHVYEWKTTGNPATRLFDIYSKGNGKSRVVTYRFKASKTPIPTINELESAGKILPVPDKIKARLKNRNYIFRQKAQFFEYGVQPAHIKPLGPNKKIFIPFSTPINGRTYAFVDRATANFQNTKYRGRFEMAFKVLSIQAAGKTSSWIENEVSNETREMGLRMGKSKSKTMLLGFSSGQDYARNRMKLSGKLINARAESETRI